MSVENIVERIRAEGKAEAEEILAAAETAAERTRADAAAEAEKLRRETEEDVKERADAVLAHYAAAARLDVKKIALAAKKRAVSDVYDVVKRRLFELSEEDAMRLVSRLLETYAEDGDRVVFAESFRYAEQAKRLPVFTRKNLAAETESRLSETIDGGMYLIGATADKDLSFSALLDADRTEHEAEIAAVLFGGEKA